MEVKKIKNILTAIGNPLLNNELKKEENIKIICNDIQYQEGIFEILEINKNIDFFIVSQLIPGKLNIEELLEKIQENIPKIKIIIILEKYDENLEKILIKKNVYRIFYNNKIKIEDIVKIISEDEKMEKYNEEIRKEIEELKKYIVENNKNNKKNNNKNKEKKNINLKNNLMKNKNINYIKNKEKILKIYNKKNRSLLILKNIFMDKLINSKILNNKILNNLFIEKINKYNIVKNIMSNSNYNKENNKENNKIISIIGNNGSGKSVFSILLAKELKKYSEKILIIDFDILNNSLHTILGVKKYPEKIKEKLNDKKYVNEINLEKLVIKINKKIDLISGIDLIFDCENKISIEKLKEIIKKISIYYDSIIIDTTSECFFDYTKEILKSSRKCIYLVEANLLEVSKSKRILEIYENNWNIEKEKINIIFNKYNKNSLNMHILKKLYCDYKILGKINLNINFNLLINKNIKYLNTRNKQKNKIKYLKVS